MRCYCRTGLVKKTRFQFMPDDLSLLQSNSFVFRLSQPIFFRAELTQLLNGAAFVVVAAFLPVLFNACVRSNADARTQIDVA